MVNTSRFFVSQTAEEAFFKGEPHQHSHLTDSNSFLCDQSNKQPSAPTSEQQKSDAMFLQYPPNMTHAQHASVHHQSSCVNTGGVNNINLQLFANQTGYTVSEERASRFGKASFIDEDQVAFPEVLRAGPPKMDRQYSINTVLEVIENHKISDFSKSSTAFSPKAGKAEMMGCAASQPIDIRRNPNASDMQRMISEEQFDRTTLGAPVSDTYSQYGCSPAYSNISTSPGPEPFPFEQYQHDAAFNLSPALCAVSPAGQNAEANVFFNELEFKSLDYPVFSPEESNATSPAYQQRNQQYEFDSYMQSPGNACFPCPDYSPQNTFKESQSCPNFTGQTHNFGGAHSLPNSGRIRSVQADSVTSPTTSAITARAHTTSTSSLSNVDIDGLSIGTNSPFSVELEEVNSPGSKEEINQAFQDRDRFLTEQDRLDCRRIRNNRACRASRQRRKMRKEQRERQQVYLEDQNKGLKAKIRQLEKECKEAKAEVLRRGRSHSLV
ncbi:uncharacterized protein LOC143470842 [Clavelina lepadiformis]|uniref:uncharacterized protein LOC143470842 n=1 Tax=Clavelina lepadiformis TaxID=159417 RepID=UPI004041FBD7